MALIEAAGVGKELGRPPSRVWAVRDVTLSIEAGELVVIAGESGSGKSTLLSLLGAMDTPTLGEIRLEGERLDVLDAESLAGMRRRRFGFVFQDFLLFRHLSVRDNLRVPFLFGEPRPGTSSPEELLDAVGVAHRAAHLPDALSRGEMQRVAVARALAGGPDILCADEPTANLDRRHAGEIWELLRSLNAERSLTVVVATHEADRAWPGARRVRLDAGRLVEDASRDPTASSAP